VIETRDPDVVLITGSPFYPMLLARMIKRRYRKPVVLDFQDPWVSAWGARQPVLSKAGLSHALARCMEPIALRHADLVTSVSERQNEEMAARYPWLSPQRVAAIPIGGDPDDYGALGGGKGGVSLAEGLTNLVYVGTLLPTAHGVVRQLFRAVQRLRQCQPDLAEQLRLTFVGTSNQPNGDADFRVMPIARAEGVDDLVTETPQRIPYLEALGLLRAADAVLLIGSEEPHYTASKIYPALLSGRPCLGLFHEASSARHILAHAGTSVLGFSSLDNLASRAGELMELLGRVIDPASRNWRAAPCVIRAYSARSVAVQFSDVLGAACGAGTVAP
jgi:hypothetical protein